MQDATNTLMAWIIRLAEALPTGTMATLTQVIRNCPAQQWGNIRIQVSQVIPQPHLRSLVVDMLSAWQQYDPAIPPGEVATMIWTAAETARSVKATQTVELVWTGPLVAGPAMRRTDQALLQVINAAEQSLLIVSFAVYKIATIAAAIVRAAERGVVIRICVEAPEPSGQKMAHDTIKALGSEVAERAAIYVWPSDQRPTDHGQTGVLHAKCAVADSRLLFISSANLTDNAMTLNIELGTLITGGTAPSTVATQFEQLIAAGILQQVRK
jgi:phosphatidylserine/phosphatidylglycerophosphate/cardiolipin synthase-like enzyme